MAYAFALLEPVGDAIHRILIEQVDRAMAQLADAKHKPAKRIHDARKRFKEIRAVLRLVRKPLGETFEIENLWFRDAGRELSAVRDTEALLEAVTKLGRFFHARRVLRKRRDEAVVLRALVEAEPSLFGSARSVRRLIKAIDVRRDTLFAAAVAIGSRVYAEDARSWRKRVRGYWHSWRG